ncbi:MAG: response regulator transcription factor [Epsilonproteobacteria bacterium]|nr:response regulator transcription factor [Campylobacterota bacterium]
MTHSKELLQYTGNLKLLFAEDHQELRESTVEILKNFFKTIDAVDDGDKALALYKNSIYDIVLTDIRMPNMDGVELAQKLYEINPQQSIIILSAHDESKYLIPLINMGVSHFIKKPIDYQELIAVLLKVSKKLLNTPRSLQPAPHIINLDKNHRYDRENKLLLEGEESIYLTKYEIIFLDILTSQSGKIFPNEDIVNYYLSQEESIDAQNIRKLVSKLRKKVPADSIESVYGVGYRVVANS